MKSYIIENILSETLTKLIYKSNLESPTEKTVTNKTIICGWLLKQNIDNNVSIIINKNEINLTEKREDVIKEIFKIADPNQHEQLACGFKYEIELNDETTEFYISIKINNTINHWKKIRVLNHTNLDIKIKQIWNQYITNSLTTLDPSMSIQIESLNKDYIEDRIIENPTLIPLPKNNNDIKTPTCITPDEQIFFKTFIAELNSIYLPEKMIASAINYDATSLPSPFHSGMCFSKESFTPYSIPNINILRFIDREETFYVLQRVTSSDLVYFPTRNLVLYSEYGTYDILKKSVLFLIKNFKKIFEYSQNSNTNKFRGIIASYSRPYHFYYEVALGIELASHSKVLEKIQEITYINGGDFCSFKELYKLNCKESKTTSEDLFKENIHLGLFSIHTGVYYKKEYNDFLTNFDEKLVKKSEQINNNASEVNQNKLDIEKSFPIIWFGITGQKRSWIDQVEGIAEIVKNIYLFFPGVAIILDGWTSPITKTISDINEIKNDNIIINSIISKINNEKIKIINTTGLTSIEKTLLAKKIDAFVCNAATGSIHTARFANKPGIGHISTAMKRNELIHPHINRKTKIVSNQYITDIPNETSADFISYKIDPKVILHMLIDVLSQETLIKLIKIKSPNY